MLVVPTTRQTPKGNRLLQTQKSSQPLVQLRALVSNHLRRLCWTQHIFFNDLGWVGTEAVRVFLEAKTIPGRNQQPSCTYKALEATCMHAQSLQAFLTLCDPMDWSPQAPLSMGLSRQEHWSGLPCPPAGDLPNPGIEPTSFTPPALAGMFFTPSATREIPKPYK